MVIINNSSFKTNIVMESTISTKGIRLAPPRKSVLLLVPDLLSEGKLMSFNLYLMDGSYRRNTRYSKGGAMHYLARIIIRDTLRTLDTDLIEVFGASVLGMIRDGFASGDSDILLRDIPGHIASTIGITKSDRFFVPLAWEDNEKCILGRKKPKIVEIDIKSKDYADVDGSEVYYLQPGVDWQFDFGQF